MCKLDSALQGLDEIKVLLESLGIASFRVPAVQKSSRITESVYVQVYTD